MPGIKIPNFEESPDDIEVKMARVYLARLLERVEASLAKGNVNDGEAGQMLAYILDVVADFEERGITIPPDDPLWRRVLIVGGKVAKIILEQAVYKLQALRSTGQHNEVAEVLAHSLDVLDDARGFLATEEYNSYKKLLDQFIT